MSEPVVAIFRKYKSDGQVIALFPELPARADNPAFCRCYTAGRFGSSSLAAVMPHTQAASPEEYAALKAEIEAHEGFDNLVARGRTTAAMTRSRKGGAP